MKWQEVNGCGACSGIMKYIPVPHGKFFKEECTEHDARYNIVGGNEERKEADSILYNSMVIHSIEYFGDRVGSQFWFICLAFLYYVSVRVFGRFYFNYKKQ